MPTNAPTGGFVAEYPLIRIDDFGTACPPLPPLVRAWAAQLPPRRAPPASDSSSSSSRSDKYSCGIGISGDASFSASASAAPPVVDLGDLVSGQTHFSPPSIYILTHAHMDHVPGLARRPPHAASILCSPTTRRILIDHETARHRAEAAADARVVSDRPFSSLSPAYAAHSRKLRRARTKLLLAPRQSSRRDQDKHKEKRQLRLSPKRLPSRDSVRASTRTGGRHTTSQRDQLVPIPFNTPTRVQYTPDVELVITLVDANHMPGAAMVLIHGPRGAILHTGDVRAEAVMLTSLASNPSVSRWIRPRALARLSSDAGHVPCLPADAHAPTDADDNCWDQDHGDQEGTLRAPQWARISAEAEFSGRSSQVEPYNPLMLDHGLRVPDTAAEGIGRLGHEMATRSWKSKITTLPLLGTTSKVEPMQTSHMASILRPYYCLSQRSDADSSQLLSCVPESDDALEISPRRLRGTVRADWSTRLVCIYVDTEAVQRGAAAPPKASAVSGLVDLLSLYPSSVEVYLHAWTWGYEEVLKGVARHFGEQIHMDSYRYHQYTVNAFESDPFLADVLTLDPAVRIHACDRAQHCPSAARRPSGHFSSVEHLQSVFVHPMEMSDKQWRTYHELVRSQIVAAAHGDPGAMWPTLLHVPLSRHSALPELRALVALFEPDNVVPNSLPGTARRGGANPASVMNEELDSDVLTYWALSAMFSGTTSHLGQDRMVADAEAWMGPANTHRCRTYYEQWASAMGILSTRTPSPALATRFVRSVLTCARQTKAVLPIPLPQPTASLTIPSAMSLPKPVNPLAVAAYSAAHKWGVGTDSAAIQSLDSQKSKISGDHVDVADKHRTEPPSQLPPAEVSTLNVSLVPTSMGSPCAESNTAQRHARADVLHDEARPSPTTPSAVNHSGRPEAPAKSSAGAAPQEAKANRSGLALGSGAAYQSLPAWAGDGRDGRDGGTDASRRHPNGDAPRAPSSVHSSGRGTPWGSILDPNMCLADQVVDPLPRPTGVPVLAPQTSASGPPSSEVHAVDTPRVKERTSRGTWHEDEQQDLSDSDRASEPDSPGFSSFSSPMGAAPTGSPCVRAAKRKRTSPMKIMIPTECSTREWSASQGSQDRASIHMGRASGPSPFHDYRPRKQYSASVVPARTVVDRPRTLSPCQRQEHVEGRVRSQRLDLPVRQADECLRHPVVLSACTLLLDSRSTGQSSLLPDQDGAEAGAAQLAAWAQLTSAYTALMMGWERALACPVTDAGDRGGNRGRPSLTQLLETAHRHLGLGANVLHLIAEKEAGISMLLMVVLRALGPLLKSLVLIHAGARWEPVPAFSRLTAVIRKLSLSDSHGSALPLYEVAEYLRVLHPDPRSESYTTSPPPATLPVPHVRRQRPHSVSDNVVAAPDMPSPLEDPPRTTPDPANRCGLEGLPGSDLAETSSTSAPAPAAASDSPAGRLVCPSPIVGSTQSSPVNISPAGIARARARLCLVTQQR